MNKSTERFPLDNPMRLRLLLFAFVFHVACVAPTAHCDDFVKLPNKKDFLIFLLIGQSNMAGRGKPLEEQDQTPHPRVLVFTQRQAWIPAVDPLHFDKPPVVGVGLGLTFAKTVAEAQDKAIGLVPAAVGGSEISAWAKGARQYTGAIGRAKAALKDGTLAGILWHQGESDSDAAKAALYQAKLDQLVQDLRTDLESPDVPFIVGTLADNAAGAGVPQINHSLRTLPDRIPHTACALATGLTMAADKIHFDAASYREFGRRYSAEWLRVAKQNERR
jgi:Carbohydrate esterase, sialic acid-specific acetylesterase